MYSFIHSPSCHPLVFAGGCNGVAWCTMMHTKDWRLAQKRTQSAAETALKRRVAGALHSSTVVFVWRGPQSSGALQTYCSWPSAGPPLRTSEMTMEVSPLWKCGLSRPPEIAMPKPNPGACVGQGKPHTDKCIRACAHTETQTKTQTKTL